MMNRLSFMIVPLWVLGPLVFLGIAFGVLYPLAVLHVFGRTFAWYAYGASLLSAAYSAHWTRRRFTTTVLERSERGVPFWTRLRGEEDASAPKVAGPVARP